jgi:hypothetical protein
MSANKRWTRDEAERVLNQLADSIEIGDPAEFAADLKDSGNDLNDVAAQMKSAALVSVKAFRQQRLQRARERYQESSAKIDKRNRQFAGSAEERRRRFLSVLESKPTLRSALTMQHRDLNELTDTDIESALDELEILGALEELDDSNS